MKKLLAFALIFALTACARVSNSDNSAAPKRVIAASGSFAEIWLLAGGELIGTTSDAFSNDYGLPENVADIGSLHNPSMEKIIALEPDLLILSADIPKHAELSGSLAEAGINAAYFSVETFADYLDMLKACADITGRADLYEQNGLSLKARIDDIINGVKGEHSPKVLAIRASSEKINVRGGDTMIGAMLGDLGCVNIADVDKSLLDTLSLEKIILDDPDFIFAVPYGDSTEKSLETIETLLKSNPAWAELTAVKNGRYIVLPKELFHLKPNARWDEAYSALAEILYG